MKIDLKSKVSAPSPAAAFSMMLGGGQRDIQQISVMELTPYPNQPFRAYTPEKLAEFAEDIREHGVLAPVIVRPMEDGYQIIAGHNRVQASRLAGLDTVPCIVKDVDDDTAQLIMVNTNLNQRQELLPSEKAFAYKMQMEAMKKQGNRTDLTSCQFGTKFRTDQQLATIANDSARTIQRYIRLTMLILPLLDMLDEQILPFGAGVELSYLTEDTQLRLVEYLNAYHFKLDLKSAELLRAHSHDGDLTRNELSSLLSKPPKPTKDKTAVKLQTTALQRYFPNKKQREVEQEILKILEAHFKKMEGSL